MGAWLDDAAQDALFAAILREAGLQPVLETPTGVEACLRVGADGREVFILINHGHASQTVSLPWQARNHLSGQIVTTLALEPYNAAVLTRVQENQPGVLIHPNSEMKDQEGIAWKDTLWSLVR